MAANVQSMCQYWKNFDLQELQRELDTTATELANRQDESEGSRKKLVEQSRDFKKNTPEDIRKIVAPLLKSFQVEVDSLSKRSKAAEASFLSVYKKLIDLPDPVPVLEHAQSLQKKAQKVQDLEIENKQLRETLEEYNHEFAEVKNQEVTIKQLKEKLREHEERVEATAQTRAKEKERELQRTFAEKERQLQETQLSVAKKLGEAEHQIASLHSALETAQSELFEVKSKYDEATFAKSDEMEMVMADLERANERAAAAERQAERLKQQLVLATENLSQQMEGDGSSQMSSTAADQAMDLLKRSTLEVELAAKEKEIAQLVEDVQRLQASLSKLRESTAAQVSKLEEELNTKNLAFRALEEKLRTQEDYEEVKRELRVLKSIEFANAYSGEGGSEDGKSLEMLLLEKNKALQTENTHLKVVNSGLTDNGDNLTAPSKHSSASTPPLSYSSSKVGEPSSPSLPHPSSSSLSSSPPPSSSTTTTAAATTSRPPAASSSSSVVPSTSMAAITNSYTGRFSVSRSSSSPATNSISIKREAPSPASFSHRGTPQTTDNYLDRMVSPGYPHPRMPSTPSSGRHSPTSNSKLSPDIPTPSQTPHPISSSAGSVPQSPITGAIHPHLDPRHFAPPPMSPFYGFPGNPFHPAFLPLNMVKSESSSPSSNSGGLDTSYVAKTVRELLSIHNIGQRLFAKHVLGLSQGTVSELLSKPKSWDKLTEKGRESYRKMHAWATDDNNILALKAISPKKGTQPLAPNNSYKEKEDTVTEERIASILNEAQVAMHMKKSLEQQQVANAVVSSIYHQELTKMGGVPPGLPMMSPNLPPTSLANGPQFSQSRADNTPSSHSTSRKSRDSDSRHHSSSSSHEEGSSGQEMVARIYRQELEKLKKAADAANNMAASAMYAQELSRLSASQSNGGNSGGSMGNQMNSLSNSSSSSRHQSHMSQPSPHPQRRDSSPMVSRSPQPSPLPLDYRAKRPNGLSLKTEPPDNGLDEPSVQTNNCGAIDLSKPSSQAGSSPSSSPTSESGRYARSAFFHVQPRMNGHPQQPQQEDSPSQGSGENTLTPSQQGANNNNSNSSNGPRYGSVPPAECLSPLQRMQNIANSLTSRPQMGMPNSKPLRAVLPPITQEEFDRYANMNTDELVKKVKETLSQYSISQRLFGESVLGLSQGSVSDLLARPKPWHMLTQKGREPFIRMQIFLEDADSIPKLVSSQYRIPPDKLMRSSSRGSNEPESPCDLALRNFPHAPLLPPLPSLGTISPRGGSPPPSPTPSSSSASSSPSSHHQQTSPSSTTTNFPPPLRPPFNPSNNNNNIGSTSTSSPFPPLALPPPPPPPPLQPPHSLPSPTPSSRGGSMPLYPLSIGPPFLQSPTTPSPGRIGPPSAPPHNLSSGLAPPLPEHFSGLQPPGGGSDLTSGLPRVWGSFAYPSSMLEVIAMTSEIDTLTLTSRVKDVLQFHNLGQKLFGEAVLGLSQGSVSELLSKPKPWHMLSIKGREPFIKMHLWLGDAQSVEHLKLYQTQMKAHRRRKSSMDERGFDSPTTPKRPRVFFTEDQKDSLRQAYAQDPYPNQSTIEALARSLNVGVKTVINWFHNHRMRAKQQHHTGSNQTGGSEASVKSELDESSNQSDMSSISGDTQSVMSNSSQLFHPGLTLGDQNQWMFPQFEPVALRKVPLVGDDENGEDNKENNRDLAAVNDEDDMDEPDGMDSCGSSNNNNNNVKEKDEEGDSRGDDEEDEDGSRQGREESGYDDEGPVNFSTCSSKDMNPGSSSSSAPASTSGPSGSVNKRKRSNPQRVYEGAQLEKLRKQQQLQTLDESDIGPDSIAGNVPDNFLEPPPQGTSDSKDCGVTPSEGNKEDDMCSNSEAKPWENENEEEEGEVTKGETIDKLQKNVDSKPSDEDWEF